MHTIRYVFWMLGLAALLAIGCAADGRRATTDFGRSIDKVRVGMTQSQVRHELGAPDRQFSGTALAAAPADPSAPLAGVVPPGSRYERWFYHRGGAHYHVYFARGALHPGRWEVAKVIANPASAAVAGTSPPPAGP